MMALVMAAWAKPMPMPLSAADSRRSQLAAWLIAGTTSAATPRIEPSSNGTLAPNRPSRIPETGPKTSCAAVRGNRNRPAWVTVFPNP